MGEFRYIGYAALERKLRSATRKATMVSARKLKGGVVAATPVDEGDLAADTRIEGPYNFGNGTIAQVAQGGGDIDYAVIVHQDHHDGGGGAKQVERPLLEHAPTHREILRAAGKAEF